MYLHKLLGVWQVDSINPDRLVRVYTDKKIMAKNLKKSIETYVKGENMKKLMVHLSIVLLILITSVSFVTPVFGWTAATTGWYNNFHGCYADWSMYLANYYKNNTYTSVELGWSYYFIDNWGTNPGELLGRLKNKVFFSYGWNARFQLMDLTINPGDFYVGYLTLGQTTYSKVPMTCVYVENTAFEQNWEIFPGMWRMWFWNNLNITTQYYP